ncbi:ABC transporter ATP-binding protein [Leptospira perolatii]|uniref:ABC transporter ATP-binding protein n=1 Tax=Leptospira perolatii TaxID=2023191 RepID=A0A2M9ZJ52_9LEPT|nr:ABC transporter ATP-binding protein [Leptospira perolatii]PJZ68184.1 ABC transporter ATP-binding protein [Leptospira perolatii]PJZ72079.1 ABC transporter ATP-binding protein [Leptospira perolatii]
MQELLQIQGLQVYDPLSSKVLLDELNLDVKKGSIYGIAGESGSGKTTFANFLLGLLHPNLKTSWNRFQFFDEDMNQQAEQNWKKWRGKRISLIPQSPSSGFHPYRKISSQILENFYVLEKEFAETRKCLGLLEKVGISDPERAWNSHPHQLSGGERQRILILLSVYSGAELILGDEPTSALDPITGKGVLDLLLQLVAEKAKTLIFISHDLGAITEIADTITVLKLGKIVETLSIGKDGWAPKSDYARKLFTIDSATYYNR